MLRVRKWPSANWSYDAVSKRAFVTGQNRIWKRMFGVPRSLAIRLTTAAMLPPTLLPTAARRRPSTPIDRKSTRLNSSHSQISYAVFCLKKKKATRDEVTEEIASAKGRAERGTAVDVPTRDALPR